jgi:hypothetical protein
MGGHVDSCQTLFFQVVDFVGPSYHLGEFELGELFTPSSVELEELAYKGRGILFMVFTIKPCPMPSPERSLHKKLEEASTRVGLKMYTANNHMVSGTRLVFQEKIVLEQGKTRGNSKKSFAEMDEDGDLNNGIGIQID